MHCWARSLLYILISILGIGQMMTACGQKGSLYLTDAESDLATPVAPRPGSDEDQRARERGLAAGDDVPVVPPVPDTLDTP